MVFDRLSLISPVSVIVRYLRPHRFLPHNTYHTSDTADPTLCPQAPCARSASSPGTSPDRARPGSAVTSATGGTTSCASRPTSGRATSRTTPSSAATATTTTTPSCCERRRQPLPLATPPQRRARAHTHRPSSSAAELSPAMRLVRHSIERSARVGRCRSYFVARRAW